MRAKPNNRSYRPLYRSRSSAKKMKRTKAVAQAKAPANKPQAIPAYPASTSRSSAGTLSPEPGTYGSGSACPATPAATAFPAASLTVPTIVSVTVSATTASAIPGGGPTIGASCPTIGAPHREHTRAVAATLAAHSRHLIWVMMAYGLGRGGVLAGSLRAGGPCKRSALI